MAKNLIAIVRSMLDSGSSVEEVVSALRDMGIPEDEARRLIILANREILLTLRNDLREIVRGVLDEEREVLLSNIREELRSYLDGQLKIVNRNLTRYLREEVGNYLSELSKLEEKVDLLEKKILSLESKVYARETPSIRIGKLSMGKLLIAVGASIIAVSLALPLDFYIKVAMALAGGLFIIGGVYLG